MNSVGILAYGSLKDDPEEEIQAVVAERLEVETPFKVEFARSSMRRGAAPTLVHVEEGGARVRAVILVLKRDISEKEAMDMLWRRETGKVGTYDPLANLGPNKVYVKRLEDFHGIDVVLYTRIAPNIDNLTPQRLAELAIQSARDKARKGRDGISYLINAKGNGVITPLMPEYEKEILRQTGTSSLEEALKVSQMNSA